MYQNHYLKSRLLKMQKCYFNTSYLLFCAFCSLLQVSYSSEMKIYVPVMDKICLIQKIGIREEILNSMGLYLSASSFRYCIAYSYSDFSPYNYSIFAYNEKARSCSPLYDIAEENIIDNCSEQLHDLQFYKVTHCLPAEGFMYSFEEEVEENVNKINAVKLKATAEICIVERHPFNMTESSERRYYNGTGKIINLRIGSMRVQCTVHEIPLLKKHMKHQCLLWNSKTFWYCIKFCARQFQANLCNAVYYEAEEKTCLHLLLNASQALNEYSESKRETVHFIEKCVEVAERHEYLQQSAINRIQSDETSISSASRTRRPRCCRTRNVREQELDFFYYVPSENIQVQYAKLYEFFEICKVQLLNISIIRNAFTIQTARKIYSLNRCLHICRRHTSCMAILFSQLHHQCKKIFKGRSSNSISVHAHEMVVALKECFKDRPDERKWNPKPLIYYFNETQEICAAEIYKQKNLTSWEVMTIDKDVSNFQRYCTANQELWLIPSAKRDQSCMSSRKIRVTVVIENFPCEMEIDTGSEYTILSECVFRKLSQGRKIRLQPITLKLATSQGELVKVKGSCSVNVQYGNIHRTLTLIVAKGHCPNLLGLNWFEPLGIHLSGVHHLMSTPPQISEVLRKYQFVFTEELGILGSRRYADLHEGAKGGKVFAKLDLAQAYQQLTVDDATADAQTIITHRGTFRVKRFEIDATGIHPAKAKVQAIQDAPTPKNKQQLQAFLGLLNFYHSFLKDKATVAEPLHRLLDKKARWTWTSKHGKAFGDTCDASPHGIGAVLCHKLSSTQEIPIALLQKVGIREEILDSIELFLFNASFKSCIAYSYSDLNPHYYSIFAYNEKTSSCSKIRGMLEENIIVNCSEQMHDLQFYKVTHCLPAEGFMYSFEEEIEENVNKINAVKLKATAEICIVERHPFSENFLLKRTGIFFLKSLELCLAHCRVLSMRGKCHAVLFSGEEKVCLLLQQNQPLQRRDAVRKSGSQLFTLNYCYCNMTESSERRYYNGSGKIINLRVESMRVQCTVHEIPLLRKHMKHQWLLWNSINFRYCIQSCARQFQRNSCNAVYFEAEEKTCLHLVLNASQALYEYSESKKETAHFIEKCVEVAEQQEYQQESAINHIQPDETSISSPSRPRSSRTHNVREQELDFFHYVAAENVEERYVKLYEFFEVCKVQLLNISIIRNAFAIEIPRRIYSVNRCLHICRWHTSCMAILFSQLHHQCKTIFKGRSSYPILVHAHEMVVALKKCFKDRPDERKWNPKPLIYYFKETQEICAAEIYKQKNLTSWEVMTIDKDVRNFQRYCTANQEL
ncbi:Transposon Ty3-G Gag-Pol polyprotein [Trichinella britovi]|uniref:RNA-directed DNA polymerase n=1 Tax=Trichinella britovi TaxID=45882 RepID=A0A0V1DFF8_TRIBR|nr:Transposon Ty3-G Gag-Pol polyprotein [Trichinella britovi]